ncbi:MAG: hypothetical protein PVI30_24305 [Myxococcales bacterium]|jgi:hypothetical protein
MERSRIWIRRLLAASVLALLALGGCGDDDGTGGSSTDAGVQGGGDGGRAGDGDALGGGTCDEGSCDFECTGACRVECLGTSCTAGCPEGECALDADFEAVAAFDCEGGRCTIDCDGASDCTVHCGGGGCLVGCDGDSRCKVSCAEDAPACEVSCEAGSIATCDNDNCQISGCEECDPEDVDESYDPSLDPADYTTTIDNPYLPLSVGATWVYEAPDEIITIEVLDETYTTETGVECVVVYDVVTDLDGVLREETWDWFAQDLEGNVWYFGEDTAEYVNGQRVNSRGSWEAGVDGALPGIVAHAVTPEVGTVYKQEYYRCEAEDLGEVVATGESVSVPAGDYEDCIRVRDFSAIEPNANEHKLFCPGVGVALVYELEPGASEGGDPVETLVSVELPK